MTARRWHRHRATGRRREEAPVRPRVVVSDEEIDYPKAMKVDLLLR